MSHTLCYLASAYSHPDPAVREARYEAACRATAELIRSGKTVIAPIVLSHPLCRYDLPSDWQFWRRYDLKLLAVCDQVIVLKIAGGEQSVGVAAEIAAARTLGKPVTFLEMPEETPHETECEGKGGE